MQTINFTEITDKKGNKYFVKKAKVSDARNLEIFLKSLSKKTTDLFHPHPFDRFLIKKLLRCKSDVRLLLISKKDENIVGYAFASKIPMVTVGYFGIVIGDRFQGRGLGGPFTNYLLDYSKSVRLNKILLNVYKINKNAVWAYKKIGFKVVRINLMLRYLVTISEIIKNFGLPRLLKEIGNAINNRDGPGRVSVWMVKKL